MAVAPRPGSNSKQMLSDEKRMTPEQKAFINGASERDSAAGGKSKPVMLRIPPDTLARIDRAAKRVGLKRAAFILSSAVERAGNMGE